jgi:hypothetical protein
MKGDNMIQDIWESIQASGVIYNGVEEEENSISNSSGDAGGT